MPITSGSVTCRPYYLSDPPTPDALAKSELDLKRHTFEPVRVDRSPRSFGWVNPRNILDTDLSVPKVMVEDFLVLGLRVDKVTVNSKLLKAHFAEAVRKVMEERKRKNLSRDERTALLEKVRQDLMSKQTPSTSLYEMAWNTSTHHLYFTGTSESLNQEFCDLFSDTFHSTPVPLSPFLRADRKVEHDGRREELLGVMPTRLTPRVMEIGPDEE